MYLIEILGMPVMQTHLLEMLVAWFFKMSLLLRDHFDLASLHVHFYVVEAQFVFFKLSYICTHKTTNFISVAVFIKTVRELRHIFGWSTGCELPQTPRVTVDKPCHLFVRLPCSFSVAEAFPLCICSASLERKPIVF